MSPALPRKDRDVAGRVQVRETRGEKTGVRQTAISEISN